MKEIMLTQGKIAIIDDEDFEYINRHKWRAKKGRNTYYAASGVKSIQMHRLIINAPKGIHVDHHDGNGLNNQKHNLRLATYGQNKSNSIKNSSYKKRLPTSKYKGVFWHKNVNKWIAQIRINKKAIHLGVFNEEIEAAKKYDEAAKFYFKEFAKPNFF